MTLIGEGNFPDVVDTSEPMSFVMQTRIGNNQLIAQSEESYGLWQSDRENNRHALAWWGLLMSERNNRWAACLAILKASKQS